MRILVTGAYGMIGSACLARLRAGGLHAPAFQAPRRLAILFALAILDER